MEICISEEGSVLCYAVQRATSYVANEGCCFIHTAAQTRIWAFNLPFYGWKLSRGGIFYFADQSLSKLHPTLFIAEIEG